MTAAAFKRSIRDLQIWCSSCMVAFSGPDPIAVLIGAKRASATLIHRIAVHPDYQRQGHGRHLLDSLGAKLAILGPPRLVAEIPQPFAAARALFRACGYAEEATLTDYVFEGQPSEAGSGVDAGSFVIPITVDDLAANGLLGEADPHVCWERSIETVTARKDGISGLAVASDERIEAYLLYMEPPGEIVSLRSFVDDGGARLKRLLAAVGGGGAARFVYPKVHAAEWPGDGLGALGFRPAGAHVRCGARAGTA